MRCSNNVPPQNTRYTVVCERVNKTTAKPRTYITGSVPPAGVDHLSLSTSDAWLQWFPRIYPIPVTDGQQQLRSFPARDVYLLPVLPLAHIKYFTIFACRFSSTTTFALHSHGGVSITCPQNSPGRIIEPAPRKGTTDPLARTVDEKFTALWITRIYGGDLFMDALLCQSAGYRKENAETLEQKETSAVVWVLLSFTNIHCIPFCKPCTIVWYCEESTVGCETLLQVFRFLSSLPSRSRELFSCRYGTSVAILSF